MLTGPEQDNLVIELTYNWGDNTYTKGDAYAQVAIQTTDGAPRSGTDTVCLLLARASLMRSMQP